MLGQDGLSRDSLCILITIQAEKDPVMPIRGDRQRSPTDGSPQPLHPCQLNTPSVGVRPEQIEFLSSIQNKQLAGRALANTFNADT